MPAETVKPLERFTEPFKRPTEFSKPSGISGEFVPKTEDGGVWYRSERYPGLRFRENALKGGADWLRAPLKKQPLIISVVEASSAAFKILKNASTKGEIPEVRSVEASRESIVRALRDAEQDRVVYLFFHTMVRGGKRYVSNVAESKFTEWSDVMAELRSSENSVFGFSCNSACLAGNKVGVENGFYIHDAMKVFRSAQTAKTMDVLLTSLHSAGLGEVSIAGALSTAVHSLRVTVETQGIVGYVRYNPPRAVASQEENAIGMDKVDFCLPRQERSPDDPNCVKRACELADLLRYMPAKTQSQPFVRLVRERNCRSKESRDLRVWGLCIILNLNGLSDEFISVGFSKQRDLTVDVFLHCALPPDKKRIVQRMWDDGKFQ